MATKFYLRNSSPLFRGTLAAPSVKKANQTDNAAGSPANKNTPTYLMRDFKGSVQVSNAGVFNSGTSPHYGFLHMWVSSPLQAQTITGGAANYTFATADLESSVNANASQAFFVYVYRPSTDGNVKTLIGNGGTAPLYLDSGVNITDLTEFSAVTETGYVVAITGKATDFACAVNDCIVVEQWVYLQNSKSTNFTITEWHEGTTDPTDTVAVASAASYFTHPQTLNFNFIQILSEKLGVDDIKAPSISRFVRKYTDKLGLDDINVRTKIASYSRTYQEKLGADDIFTRNGSRYRRTATEKFGIDEALETRNRWIRTIDNLGVWSDPTNWVFGHVPITGERVIFTDYEGIGTDTYCNVDTNTAEIKSLTTASDYVGGRIISSAGNDISMSEDFSWYKGRFYGNQNSLLTIGGNVVITTGLHNDQIYMRLTGTGKTFAAGTLDPWKLWISGTITSTDDLSTANLIVDNGKSLDISAGKYCNLYLNSGAGASDPSNSLQNSGTINGPGTFYCIYDVGELGWGDKIIHMSFGGTINAPAILACFSAQAGAEICILDANTSAFKSSLIVRSDDFITNTGTLEFKLNGYSLGVTGDVTVDTRGILNVCTSPFTYGSLTNLGTGYVKWCRYSTEPLGIDDINIITSGAAATYSRIVIENLGIDDLLALKSIINRNYIDMIGADDSFIRLFISTKALVEQIGLSDVFTKVGRYNRKYSDNIGLDDVFIRSGKFARLLADMIGADDVLSKTAILNRICSESLGALDTYSRIGAFSRLMTEILGVRDNVVAGMYAILSVIATERIGIDDINSNYARFIKALSEKLGIDDTLLKSASFIKTITDKIGTDDSLNIFKVYFKALNEALGVDDTLEKVAIFMRNYTDKIGIDDQYRLTGIYLRKSQEKVGIADSIIESSIILRAFQELLGTQDSVKTISLFKKFITETIGVDDLHLLNMQLNRFYTEEIGIDDILFRTTPGLLSIIVAEVLGMKDNTSHIGEFIRKYTDEIGLKDSELLQKLMIRILSDELGIADEVLHLRSIITALVEEIGIDDTAELLRELTRSYYEELGIDDAFSILAPSVVYTRLIEEMIGLFDTRLYVSEIYIYEEFLGPLITNTASYTLSVILRNHSYTRIHGANVKININYPDGTAWITNGQCIDKGTGEYIYNLGAVVAKPLGNYTTTVTAQKSGYSTTETFTGNIIVVGGRLVIYYH